MIRKLYLILSITRSICSSRKHSFPSQRHRGRKDRARQVLTLATSPPDGWGVESRLWPCSVLRAACQERGGG